MNYACHCTTLGGEFNQICADWAGYAQEYVEREHPGAVCLVNIGCGADANPEPRTGLDYAKQHGRTVADEVDQSVGSLTVEGAAAGKASAQTAASGASFCIQSSATSPFCAIVVRYPAC